MTQQARQRVGMCGSCSKRLGPGADRCPRCGSKDVRDYELGTMPGAEGVVPFVPGTDTPAANVVVCRFCTKVSRLPTASYPSDCPKCGASGKEGSPDWWVAVGPKVPDPAPVVALPGRVGQAGEDPEIGGQDEAVRPAELAKSADEYRHEWIAEAVREFVTKQIDPARLLIVSEGVWAAFEQVYDEGRKRGHLP